MAFLRLPAETKKGAAPVTQAPRAIPRAVPKPAARPAPGPTTVLEGPKRRMIGLGAVRVQVRWQCEVVAEQLVGPVDEVDFHRRRET